MSPPAGPRIRLDPSLPVELASHLPRLFTTLRWTEDALDPQAPLLAATSGPDAPPASGPLILLHGGRLQDVPPAVLSRAPPPLIWALREEGAPPTLWEGRILSALLAGQSLRHLLVGKIAKARSLTALEEACEEVEDAARTAGAGATAAALAAEVLHELGGNALLDAPVDAQGLPRYALRREEVSEVAEEDACELRFLIAAGHAFLFAHDAFGRLTFDPIRETVLGLGSKARVNTAGGGAGLGLRRMLEASDLLAAQVVPGRSCGVLCGVDLGDSRRRRETPKSLFFSKVES